MTSLTKRRLSKNSDKFILFVADVYLYIITPSLVYATLGFGAYTRGSKEKNC